MNNRSNLLFKLQDKNQGNFTVDFNIRAINDLSDIWDRKTHNSYTSKYAPCFRKRRVK